MFGTNDWIRSHAPRAQSPLDTRQTRLFQSSSSGTFCAHPAGKSELRPSGNMTAERGSRQL
eukprot:8303673-Pyramimonas_sp.AAC.1